MCIIVGEERHSDAVVTIVSTVSAWIFSRYSSFLQMIFGIGLVSFVLVMWWTDDQSKVNPAYCQQEKPPPQFFL